MGGGEKGAMADERLLDLSQVADDVVLLALELLPGE
jgi:hypothetical protein